MYSTSRTNQPSPDKPVKSSIIRECFESPEFPNLPYLRIANIVFRWWLSAAAIRQCGLARAKSLNSQSLITGRLSSILTYFRSSLGRLRGKEKLPETFPLANQSACGCKKRFPFEPIMSRGEVLTDLFNFNSVVANFCRKTTSSVFTVTFRALGNCAAVFVYRVCEEFCRL